MVNISPVDDGEPSRGATEIQEQIMHYVTGIQWTKEYYQETYMAQ